MRAIPSPVNPTHFPAPHSKPRLFPSHLSSDVFGYRDTMAFRPSRSFVWSMLTGVPLLVGLSIGVLSELQNLRKPPLPGEIVFSSPRPASAKISDSSFPAESTTSQASSGSMWSMDWLWETWDRMLTWEKNPWKIEPKGFGAQFLELMGSKSPEEQARAKELTRLADGLYQQMLARYPELAVTLRSVPDERNGFLKLLELAERHSPSGRADQSPSLPPGLSDLLKKTSWDAAATKEMLLKEKSLLDEIRSIGLMPERSIADIEIWRFGFTHGRFHKSCADLLLADARLAAEEGRPEDALESIRAANGIASHLGEIETSSLLATTFQILIRNQTQRQFFSNIMPAISSGGTDVAAWESALFPPSEVSGNFAQITKGEWNVTARQFLTPMLMDTADPLYPPDPEALLDAHASFFLKLVQDHEGIPIAQWQSVPVDHQIPGQHLSYRSSQLTDALMPGLNAWRKGWEREQHQQGLFRAAFSIMKGEPIPPDPIFGKHYRWDPNARTLSLPDSPEFENMTVDQLVIPKP